MNKKIIFIVLAILAVALLFFGAKFLLGKDSGPAVLKISANPAATIFLDGAYLGKTPYEDKVKSGEYTLKLAPDSGSKAIPWEIKLKLNSGTMTFVNRDLSESELTSAGEVLTLEKISGQSAEMVVISTPDGATVNLDNNQRGVTPLSLPKIEPGDHDLLLSETGFSDRTLKIRTTPGFKLTASFQLALDSSATTVSASTSPTPATTSASPKPTATPRATVKSSGTPTVELPRPYVKILETNLTCESTTCLNVRMEPNKSATISATVKTGETYSLLDQQSGWYQIKYQGQNSGWISGQYAEKFE